MQQIPQSGVYLKPAVMLTLTYPSESVLEKVLKVLKSIEK